MISEVSDTTTVLILVLVEDGLGEFSDDPIWVTKDGS